MRTLLIDKFLCIVKIDFIVREGFNSRLVVWVKLLSSFGIFLLPFKPHSLTSPTFVTLPTLHIRLGRALVSGTNFLAFQCFRYKEKNFNINNLTLAVNMNETKKHMMNGSWDSLSRYGDVKTLKNGDLLEKNDVILRPISRTNSFNSGMESPLKSMTPLKHSGQLNGSPQQTSSPSPFNSPGHSITSGESSPSMLVNYSPKHNRKPSSLSLNRNINMKSLSLNLDEKERKKSLTLSIPNNSPPKSPFISNSPTSSISSSSSTTTTTTTGNNPNIILLANQKQFHLKQSNPQSPEPAPLTASIQTSKDYKFPDTIDNFKLLLIKKVPEELQELSQLNAYPNGPSNVLNGCIYLYSEPTIEDLNSFDLVINVAKECPQIKDDFRGKYVYVPWNHTSSISKDLANLTNIIKEFDDSDKFNNDNNNLNDNDDNDSNDHRRKILVHCQCGVSRSACVIVAYFMLKFNLNVNDAYELLKSGTSADSTAINKDIYEKGYKIQSCSRICPNMSLIFELMDFYETIKPT